MLQGPQHGTEFSLVVALVVSGAVRSADLVRAAAEAGLDAKPVACWDVGDFLDCGFLSRSFCFCTGGLF